MLVQISRRTHLYLSPVGHILILISRRTHTYSESSHTVLNLYIYLDRGTYPHTHTSIYLILVQIARRSYRVYAYTEVPLGTTIYLYYRVYTCSEVPVGTIEIILVFRSIYLSYGTYTCDTELILVFRILYLYYGYGSTHRCYRDFTCTQVLVGTIEQI